MVNVLLIRSLQIAGCRREYVNGAVPKDLGCRSVPGGVLAPVLGLSVRDLDCCPWQPGAALATIPADHGRMGEWANVGSPRTSEEDAVY